jgi:hypothetical protein
LQEGGGVDGLQLLQHSANGLDGDLEVLHITRAGEQGEKNSIIKTTQTVRERDKRERDKRERDQRERERERDQIDSRVLGNITTQSIELADELPDG